MVFLDLSYKIHFQEPYIDFSSQTIFFSIYQIQLRLIKPKKSARL